MKISKIKVLVAALAGVFAGSVAFGANITNVQTNECDFVWIGEASSGYSGADVAAGKITGYNFFKGSNADGSGVSYITNDLTIAAGTSPEGGMVRIIGRNLTGWSKASYDAALTNGGAAIVYAGPAAGSGDEVVTIDIEGKSGLIGGWRNNKTFGDPDGNARNGYVTFINGEFGGYAKFIVNGYLNYGNVSVGKSGLWAEHFIISENAKPKQGESTIDFLELGVFSGATAEQGSALLQEFHNKSAYDARILFNGGRLYLWYIGCGNEYDAIYADAGRKLIFESINGQSIRLYKEAKSANLAAGGGTVKFVSGEPLRIMGNSYWTFKEDDKNPGTYIQANFLPWRLQGSVGRLDQAGSFTTRIDWSEFSGDIVIGSEDSSSSATGLQLCGNDQLPWGPGKGKVIVALRSWSDTDTARTEVSALLLDEGRQVHLNGLVNAGAQGSKCYVSNTTASASSAYSTFILGDGDVDGQLSIRVTAKCAIEKVGAGTLTIVDTTFEEGSKLTLREGTTIIDEAIYNEIKDREGVLTVEDGATVVPAKLLTVASGTTPDANLYDDGETPLAIIKRGAGTLQLTNAENSFSGGLVIDEGIVEITAAGAQGTGKITVNSTSTKTCQIFFNTPVDASPVFDNDILVTGPSVGNNNKMTYAAVRFGGKNVTFNGTITALDDLYIRDDPTAIGGTGEQTTLIVALNGPIDVTGHTLTLSVASRMDINGMIAAKKFYSNDFGTSYRGNLYLQCPTNRIDEFEAVLATSGFKARVAAAGAMDGATIKLTGLNGSDQGGIRGTFDPSADTFVKSIDSDPGCRKTEVDFSQPVPTIGANVANTTVCALTITGRDDVDLAQYYGCFGCKGYTIVLDARDGFTQVFSNTYCNSEKELKVAGGTLVLAGKTYFPAITKLTVAGRGVLDIRELGTIDPAKTDNLSKVSELALSSIGKLKLPDGVSLSVAAATVDGCSLKKGTYTSADYPWFEGTGSITVTEDPTFVGYKVWSGGAGEDTLTTTTTNWADGILPLDYTMWSAKFGTGGAKATFPAGATEVESILFDRGDDFTVEGADETTTLKIASGITVSEADAPHTYTITAPIELASETVMGSVAADQTLKITGGAVRSAAEGNNLKVGGAGTLAFEDAAISGDFENNGLGNLSITGSFGTEGDTGVWKQHKSNVYLSNAVVYKTLSFDASMGAALITTDAGVTNVFKGVVRSSCAQSIGFTPGGCVVFEGGYQTTAKYNLSILSAVAAQRTDCVIKSPINLKDGSLAGEYGQRGATLTVECDQNVVGSIGAYLNFVLNVDNAFQKVDGSPAALSGGGGGSDVSLLNLTTTHQKFATAYYGQLSSGAWGSKAAISGDYPSELEVTTGFEERALTNVQGQAQNRFMPSTISGWVKLTMSGPNYFYFGSPDATGDTKYGSYGDLEVSNGTMELAEHTKWPYGTNIIVRGTGRLILNSDKHFGAQAVIRLADNGKLVLPANTALSVKNLYVNGLPIRKGTYSYSATDFPWLEGEGVTITATADPEPLVNVWTGEGADTLTTTAENWERVIQDPRAVLSAEFGAGGSEAVFPSGETAFESIVFSREGGFTLKGADETATIKLAKREAIAFAGGGTDEPVVYTVEPKLQFGSDETMIDVKEPNQTLVLKGEIVGAEDLLKKGVGTLELDGATLSGDFRHETAGTLVLKGEIGSGDDGAIFVNPKNMYTTFAGATIDRQVEFVDGNGAAASNVVFKQGTTTVFKKPVAIRKQDQNSVYVFGEKDANIVFKDELKLAAGSPGQSLTFCALRAGDRFDVTLEGGLNLGGCNFNIGAFNFHGGYVHFKNPKNVVGALSSAYGRAICYYDDQFTNSNGYATLQCTGGGSTISVLDLNGTSQKFANAYLIVNKGTVSTEAGKPATLEITQGRANREAFISSMFCPNSMTGPVTIKMSGSGYLLVSTNNLACACATTGDLVVENGTVEIANKATFPNVPNVRVTGGQLKLDANPFGSTVTVRFGESAGTLDLTADVNCRTAYIGAQRVEAGEYSAGDGTAVGARLSGAGKLIVHSSGMILMLK